jgi:hypothetical protein
VAATVAASAPLLLALVLALAGVPTAAAHKSAALSEVGALEPKGVGGSPPSALPPQHEPMDNTNLWDSSKKAITSFTSGSPPRTSVAALSARAFTAWGVSRCLAPRGATPALGSSQLSAREEEEASLPPPKRLEEAVAPLPHPSALLKALLLLASLATLSLEAVSARGYKAAMFASVLWERRLTGCLGWSSGL